MGSLKILKFIVLLLGLFKKIRNANILNTYTYMNSRGLHLSVLYARIGLHALACKNKIPTGVVPLAENSLSILLIGF